MISWSAKNSNWVKSSAKSDDHTHGLVVVFLVKWFAYVQYVCGSGRFSHIAIFKLLNQNGDVYRAAKLPCKNMSSKSCCDLL